MTLSFLGIFTFTAPYLPWVLLAFSLVLRSNPVVDLMGMLAGTFPFSSPEIILFVAHSSSMKSASFKGGHNPSPLCASAGHCYYFLEDVYPHMSGRRPLRTPGALLQLNLATGSMKASGILDLSSEIWLSQAMQALLGAPAAFRSTSSRIHGSSSGLALFSNHPKLRCVALTASYCKFDCTSHGCTIGP